MFRILLTSIFLYSFSLSSLVSAMTMHFSLMNMDHSMMNMSYSHDSVGEDTDTLGGEYEIEDTQQIQDGLQRCIQHCLSDMGMSVFSYGYFSVNDKEKIHTKHNFLTQRTTLYHRTSIPPIDEDKDTKERAHITIQESAKNPLLSLSPYEHYVGITLLSI